MTSISSMLRDRLLDAELGAHLWLLIEARVPLLVAAPAGSDAGATLTSLLQFLPPDVDQVTLRGAAETFDWLPQATDLGWPGVARAPRGTQGRAGHSVILAPTFSADDPAHAWGPAARVAVRAASIGYGLAATIEATSLDEVFEALRQPPVGLVDDELSHLGLVVVLGRNDSGDARVVAAHYVRPIVRDTHGHLQRLGPAVLATWDAATDGFEHFGWGVIPELARRTNRPAGDHEIEVDRRADYLTGLVRAGILDPPAVQTAIRAYRPAGV
ncbi:MAG: hypothetical protein H0T59_09000 [Chloroflexi bacterium]|nr:hypothetical protein [Chloroflexota bacterium]